MNEKNKITGKFPGDRTGKIQLTQRCSNCDRHIVKTAKLVDGVIKAKWNTNSNVLIVKFDDRKTSLKAIEWEIAEAGHDTPSYKGNIKFYSHIPKCCQYHDELNNEI
jgi:copper chaperone CopZ